MSGSMHRTHDRTSNKANEVTLSKRTKTAQFEQRGTAITDLCGLVCSDDIGALRLVADQNSLFDEGIETPGNGLKFELRAPSVPLTRILASTSLKQDRERKLLLSYFLAKAVWQFYDSDWMTVSWTKDTVHFMRSLQIENTLDHRPFFSAGFGMSNVPITFNAGKSHIYPKILALGIMLLEIEVGNGIESHLVNTHRDENGNERPNARHAVAAAFITTQKWAKRPRIYKPIREAIETCVGPDTTKLGQDPAQVRANLYRYVVAPLSALCEMMWDLPPEQQDLGPFTFDGNGNGTFSDRIEGDHSRRIAAQSGRSDQSQPLCAAPRDDAVLLSSASSVNDSHTWLNKFDFAVLNLHRLANSHHPGENPLPNLQTVLKSGHYRDVKVAILDTGVDINHKFFSGPGESQRDNLEDRWFDCLDASDDPVDEDDDQHGTALVALMLRLVPGAKVYVFRVAKNKAGLSAAKPAIVQAIVQAVTKCKVDIVSMSFGFSEDVKDIQDSITDAARDHNVLFFAAANNDGKNEPELFPALHETVISVRGTDHEGAFMTRYNPDSWQHKSGPQYGSLAQEVPWEWKSNSLTKSGCSFSTPIVAAIAALIIAFADNETTLADYRHLIRTRRGMLAVFSGMTSKSQDTLRLYLAPWQLFEGNRNPAFEIGKALTSIP